MTKERRSMDTIKKITEVLRSGDATKVRSYVQHGLNEGLSWEDILNKGLFAGMEVVGKLFKEEEVFIPDVLLAAKAMDAGIKVLEPFMMSKDVKRPSYKVVLGTVKGDIHDLGKNLVKIMLKGAGFEAEMKDKIETIIEKETEPRRIEQIGDSEYSLNAYRNDEKTRKVLRALFNPTYTWRYVQGISMESDLPMDEALEALNDLLSKNIVSSSKGDHGTLWCLTAKGRNLFRNIEGASIENKGQASK